MTELLVAIVDDDLAVRESLATLMQSAGYSVAMYESADAFLARDGTVTPDVLILDVQMPGLSGFDLKARLDAEGCAPPTVFITGNLQEHLTSAADALRAYALFRKPFKAVDVLRAVREALNLTGD